MTKCIQDTHRIHPYILTIIDVRLKINSMMDFGRPLYSYCPPDTLHPSLLKLVLRCAAGGLEPVYNVTGLKLKAVDSQAAKLKSVMETSLAFNVCKYSPEVCLVTLRDFIRELKEPLILDSKPFHKIYRLLYRNDGIALSKVQM